MDNHKGAIVPADEVTQAEATEPQLNIAELFAQLFERLDKIEATQASQCEQYPLRRQLPVKQEYTPAKPQPTATQIAARKQLQRWLTQVGHAEFKAQEKEKKELADRRAWEQQELRRINKEIIDTYCLG